MKDLHIKLDTEKEIMLKELAKYANTSESEMIRTLIQIAYESAATQVILSEKYPDKLPDDIDCESTYLLMHITDIFDHLYPPVEEL